MARNPPFLLICSDSRRLGVGVDILADSLHSHTPARSDHELSSTSAAFFSGEILRMRFPCIMKLPMASQDLRVRAGNVTGACLQDRLFHTNLIRQPFRNFEADVT